MNYFEIYLLIGLAFAVVDFFGQANRKAMKAAEVDRSVTDFASSVKVSKSQMKWAMRFFASMAFVAYILAWPYFAYLAFKPKKK